MPGSRQKTARALDRRRDLPLWRDPDQFADPIRRLESGPGEHDHPSSARIESRRRQGA
jgi:hypothetical protein